MEKPNESVLAAIISALRGDSPGRRFNAAQALVGFGPSVLEHLEGLTRDPDSSIRETAIWVLGRMGPAANPVVESIARCLLDEERDVREKASEALRQIGTLEALQALESKASVD